MPDTPGDMETSFGVRSFDAAISVEAYNDLPKLPLYFILDNLRSAFNVGCIFRTCDILRLTELILCGYTAYPPNRKLEKTSLGTTRYVPWRHLSSTLEAIAWFQERGIPVWAAETTAQSASYLQEVYPPELAIVLGNETVGIGQEVLEKCDRIIELPTYGFKNSLNVACACTALGYSFLERVGMGEG